MVIEIRLSKIDMISTVDDIDADLARLKWTVRVYRTVSYAVGKPQKSKSIGMHRFIMERILGRKLESYEIVDHRDGNGLNNTRANLRLASRSQNRANSRMHKNNTSGYKGVSWHKASGKWSATIGWQKKLLFIGLFDTPEEAHEAYKEKARELHGEFAKFE